MVDIARDPRWGRQEETLGEDATLVSRLGVAFIKGMQGDGLKDGIAATPKHLVLNDMESGRSENDQKADDATLVAHYGAPRCVELCPIDCIVQLAA